MNLGAGLPMLSGTVAVFLSLLFAQSAASKLMDREGFATTIDAYQLIPSAAVVPTAFGLIAAELLAIVATLIPSNRPLGAWVAITLLLGYAVAMSINLSRGRDHIDCGCGGAGQPISSTLVMRNVFLAAIGMLLPIIPSPSLAVNEVVLAGASGITLWLGWTVAEQLQANSTHLRRGRKGQS